MSLRPGDIVTEEPTEPGTVIGYVNPEASRFTRTLNGTWCDCGGALDCVGITWAQVQRYLPKGFELRLVSAPEAERPSAEPAEAWEPVTADQVRVGDHIEASFSGRVTGWDRHVGYFSLAGHDDAEGLIPFHYAGHTIRRRVRAPMPEPDAPAIVRHAGRLLARSEHDQYPGLPWLLISGDDFPDGTLAGAWPEVLALDPSTDPVVVDLGGGA